MRDLLEIAKRGKQNSMFYWYPKIKDLDIPQPKTEMYKFTKQEFKDIQNERTPKTLLENCKPIAKKIGFPLFMRTDNSSCKHRWLKTCYVPDIDSLEYHFFELLSTSAMQGWMSYNDTGLSFREFLELDYGYYGDTKFTAFYGEFPVNKERRYFIKDGGIQCHHPYWYPNAIRNSNIESPNKEMILEQINSENKMEIELLSKYALEVASVFSDYWSVDFAKGLNEKWYLIDMARGENSFHWLECKYCSKDMKEQYRDK